MDGLETLERPLVATDEKAAMRCVFEEKSETNMMVYNSRICLMPQLWAIIVSFRWPCVDEMSPLLWPRDEGTKESS